MPFFLRSMFERQEECLYSDWSVVRLAKPSVLAYLLRQFLNYAIAACFVSSACMHIAPPCQFILTCFSIERWLCIALVDFVLDSGTPRAFFAVAGRDYV